MSDTCNKYNSRSCKGKGNKSTTWTVPELKEMLTTQGLSTNGLKGDLCDRLDKFCKDQKIPIKLSQKELYEKLIDSAKIGNLSEVEFLLDKDEDIYDEEPLLGASEDGDIKVVELLLEKGADIHAYDDAALRWAAANGQLEVVKLLLDRGANIHAKDEDPLILSSQQGHLEVVRFLLDKGADIRAEDDDALIWAAENGHLEVVKLLLDRGANIHAQDDLALRFAAQNGHLDVVELLLDNKAKIHAKNDYALRIASEKGYLKIVELLLDRGADIHAKDDDALRLAAKNGHLEVVKFLIERGAQIDLLDLEKFISPDDKEMIKIISNAVKVKKTAKQLSRLIQRKKTLPLNLTKTGIVEVTPWQEICTYLQKDYKFKELQELATTIGINIERDNGIIKSKRELCHDFAIDYEKFSEKMVHYKKPYILDPSQAIKTYQQYFGIIPDAQVTMEIVQDNKISNNLRIKLDKIMIERSTIVKIFLKDTKGKTREDTQPSSTWIENQNKFVNSNQCLNEKFCNIIRGYTYHGDVWINRVLRGQQIYIPKVVEKSNVYNSMIESMLDKLKMKETDENKVLALKEIGKLINNIILSSPETDKYITVYRGEKTEYDGSPKVGGVFVNKGIMSTTIDINVAKNFAADKQLLKILLPPKSHALKISDNCTKFPEKEILLPHGCKFMVLEIKDDKITLILVKQSNKSITICDVI